MKITRFSSIAALGAVAALSLAGCAATETPQPITNTFPTPVTVDGTVYAPGPLMYPGFDADLLWKFRWYSLIDQALIWAVIGLVFGGLVERYLGGTRKAAPVQDVAAAR